jgi:two-component system, cell cycle sensor histidine kinase and response regulator CckA
VRETLEHQGYKVLEAAGPEQAGKISRSYEGTIHLMITDVVMPRESGHSLAQRLTKLRPNMKVIYMSGYTDTRIEGITADKSQVAFLQKPFSPAALTRTVRQVLNPANGDKTWHAGE